MKPLRSAVTSAEELLGSANQQQRLCHGQGAPKCVQITHFKFSKQNLLLATVTKTLSSFYTMIFRIGQDFSLYASKGRSSPYVLQLSDSASHVPY